MAERDWISPQDRAVIELVRSSPVHLTAEDVVTKIGGKTKIYQGRMRARVKRLIARKRIEVSMAGMLKVPVGSQGRLW